MLIMRFPSALELHSIALAALVIGLGVLASDRACAREPDASARIELRPRVETGRREVSLGEVANISSSSLAFLQRLMALPLGRVPGNGEAVQLNRAALTQWIRQRLGVDAAQLAWTDGVASSSVRLTTTEVAGESISRAAQDRLREALKAGGLRAEVNALQIPRDFSIPAGRVEIVPRAASLAVVTASTSSHSDAAPPRRQTVWVDIWADGQFARSVPVGFEVNVYGPGYVATRDLVAGQAVQFGGYGVDGLMLSDVNWSANATRPVSGPGRGSAAPVASETSGVATLRLRRSVPAGQTLTRGDVEPVPSVARGNFATLRTQQGDIALETRVEVLQDAAIGQSVRVKLPNASTSIMAHVVGLGQVEVRE